ncbi:MAG TPA: response regulator transcription factor [Polyangiaceae bacterium]|nr:response regulator transcription factor [Polyangiaceae bacterium]
MRVLVVDDHLETRQLLLRNLQLDSHSVKAVDTCAEAEVQLSRGDFDVVVLDIMLPDGSGLELCSRLRMSQMNAPILLLTARGDVKSRVLGLESGADDYLPKPFAVSELRARVKALGRRGPIARGQTIARGGLEVDLDARRVRVDGRALPLTARELAIIELLATRRGRVVQRDELIESVWGELTDSARSSLEVLVARIRRKLGRHAHALRTVRNLGYVFEVEE